MTAINCNDTAVILKRNIGKHKPGAEGRLVAIHSLFGARAEVLFDGDEYPLLMPFHFLEVKCNDSQS